ncbi:hypothetical protein CW736_02165 [Nonlabens sp. MB-3u-79]|jgi:hypothetical protein|uniref:hypothetical protein n=1 Tax=Nonlabens sp. MB-3u-79 TaxID=2058134 RepID=UPI000C2FF86D|nr:hypothetical protein [Nonlabens sp. MB-3u-79]AUC78277.1 hypothetical protein CW736_02165 [Nonlabens sp. MB-3u-79]
MKNFLLTLILFPLIIVAQELKEIIKYEKDNYSIEHPSNWILNDSGENGTNIFLYPTYSESSDVFTENINLIVQNLNDLTINIEKYKGLVEKQISGMLTEPKITLSELKNKNGLKCHQFVAEGEASGYKFKTIIHTYLIDKQIYTLTFVTLYETYENNHIESLRIMNSFKLIKH